MIEFAERINRYREILANDPASRIYVPLADLLRESGDLEEALNLLEEGLARNPEHQSGMVVLGHTLLETGRPDHGVKVLQRVLELSPDNFVVLRTLVENFLSRDAFTHAVPLLERLTALESDQSEWPKLLADARERLLQSDGETAPSDDLSPDQDGAPETTTQDLATMTLVDILVAQGYLDKALVALERMRKQDPERPDVLERIAQLRAGVVPPGALGKGGSADHDSELSPAEKRAQRRARQKQEFGNWINQQNSNQGQVP